MNAFVDIEHYCIDTFIFIHYFTSNCIQLGFSIVIQNSIKSY